MNSRCSSFLVAERVDSTPNFEHIEAMTDITKEDMILSAMDELKGEIKDLKKSIDTLHEKHNGRIAAVEVELALLKQRMWLISSGLAIVFSAGWNLIAG